MNWKVLGKKFLFPPVWLMVLFTVVSTTGIILIFGDNRTTRPIAYVMYVIAFYTLCVLSAFFVRVFPRYYWELKTRVHANPLGHRYLTDAAFKTHVSLCASLGVNLLYVALNVLSWGLYRSMWFVVLAVYYTILAVMRFLLVRYVRGNAIGRNRLGELRRAKLCSCILLLVNVALSGAVLMILYRNKGYDYHGILIYVMAMYTFYITTHAIIDLIRYRKYKSPVMTTSKVIALSAALVSMLNLETAMFSQFGQDMSAEHQWLMIALTGAGVSVAVLVMSVCMIAKTDLEIKETEKHGR